MNHDLWTPVHVGLPDEETDVIVATDDGHVEAGFLEQGNWRWLNATLISVPVTHWMPFPLPPTKEAA